jgi:UDP-N-acetylglucosamine 4,6-dehydratase
MFQDKVILITGGTGTLGKALVSELVNHKPNKIIIFSRDEYKQSQMQKVYNQDCIRYFIGDIRDYERLNSVIWGNKVNIVIHAAALKQIPAAEYNPYECIKTNVLGAQNVIEAAIDAGVEKVVALSTDKAVSPINLYGAAKLCAEKLFTAVNSY